MPKFFLTGLTQAIAFELEPGFNTVGRNPTNDLRVRDATVSSFHCEIVVDGGSVRVRDLGSSNGTFVNGAPVEEARLSPESVLRLGSVEFRLQSREDEESVRVVVPKVPVDLPLPSSPTMPDGCPACLHHRTAHAAFRCTRCGKNFCANCVRELQITTGRSRIFCPSCSGLCDPLPVPADVITTPAKKGLSILGRLSQTIHIRAR